MDKYAELSQAIQEVVNDAGSKLGEVYQLGMVAKLLPHLKAVEERIKELEANQKKTRTRE